MPMTFADNLAELPDLKVRFHVNDCEDNMAQLYWLNGQTLGGIKLAFARRGSTIVGGA